MIVFFSPLSLEVCGTRLQRRYRRAVIVAQRGCINTRVKSRHTGLNVPKAHRHLRLPRRCQTSPLHRIPPRPHRLPDSVGMDEPTNSLAIMTTCQCRSTIGCTAQARHHIHQLGAPRAKVRKPVNAAYSSLIASRGCTHLQERCLVS